VIVLVLVGLVVGGILLFTGGDDNGKNATVATSGSTAPTAPTTSAPAVTAPTTPATPPPAAAPPPKPKPATKGEKCDPIFEGSTPHAVTSSAKGGTAPASCTEAHSVLLTALNSKSATVGSWHCVAQPNNATLAQCKSGGRTITAAD
jgi:hypothetical protein